MMAIPYYQTMMLPILRFAGDKKEHSLRKAIEYLAGEFKISKEERRKKLTEGYLVIKGRVDLAHGYLKISGLLEFPREGSFRIAERRLDVLFQKPKKIDNRFLEQFTNFPDYI